MDFTGDVGFSGGSIGPPSAADTEVSGGGGMDNWGLGPVDQAMWASNDDYRAWDIEHSSETHSNSNYSGGQSQNPSGIEPPSKKTRNSQSVDSQSAASNRSKAIGKMFYKTKLCCKFRAGVCPYVSNCNFAHGMEELRKPPPNWQEIVAAHEGDRGGFPVEQREEHQIPTISSPELRMDSQRSYKGRHCKKFYTEEGCPYGDNCTFLHDEHSRARESVAISVTPTVGGGYGNNGNGSSQKPSNWKTRICNKWETTGYCPFGSKCHFAHGIEELHKYGGVLPEADGKRTSVAALAEPKLVGVSLRATDAAVASTFSSPQTDVYQQAGMGTPAQRLSVFPQRPNQRPLQKWKGPDKISRIYGDWIDDVE